MSALLRRSAGVSMAILVTVLVVYGAVESFTSSETGQAFARSSEDAGQVCPATGCYATTCHATQGGAVGKHGRGAPSEALGRDLQ